MFGDVRFLIALFHVYSELLYGVEFSLHFFWADFPCGFFFLPLFVTWLFVCSAVTQCLVAEEFLVAGWALVAILV